MDARKNSKELEELIKLLSRNNFNQRQINTIIEILRSDNVIDDVDVVYECYYPDEKLLEIVAGKNKIKILRRDDTVPSIILVETKSGYVNRYIVDIDGRAFFISESDY